MRSKIFWDYGMIGRAAGKAAIPVADNATDEVLAHIGSPAYFDERRAGQVDVTLALRSPRSTLKPFIYSLGFEDGFIHPETLIDDRPQRYGAATRRAISITPSRVRYAGRCSSRSTCRRSRSTASAQAG
jgi:membrane carboxypeptidase/penicillin-binding protein PbpC